MFQLPIPAGSTYNDELRTYRRRIKRRFIISPVRERVEYEYNIITTKGYAPYFLVVADLLAFTRQAAY